MQNNSNKLAVISLVINFILIIAVVVLFVKMPSSDHEAVDVTDVDSTDLSKMHEKGDGAVFVYYNSDSLNYRSEFVKDLQKEIMDAQISAENKLKAKQDEMIRWDKKWQSKGPLISSEQMQYQQEGEKLQLELMELQQTLEQELMETQTRLTLTGVTRIQKYCRDLALANGYDYVISYQVGGQFLFCNPKMDITNELIELMNTDYDTTSTATPTEAETTE